MKRILYFILSLLCCGGSAFSQTETTELQTAYFYISGLNGPYYPERGFEIFKKYADQDMPYAMNALGILYQSGTGVEIDYGQAAFWFKKAAEAGYPQGWYNLGMLYKYDYGFDQDFEKAFKSFRKAADMDFVNGKYATGYMLYKGLGCKQNYEEAFSLFLSASEAGHAPSIYMLGLCYRNGYGVRQNEKKALKLLHQSDLYGYYLASRELKAGSPENNFHDITNKLRKSVEYETGSPATFIRVKHDISERDISGEYRGYITTYDWSGQHILREEPLKMQIVVQDSKFMGYWLQDDSLSAKLQGEVTDSSIVFANSQYKYTDQYSIEPILYQFKQANINIVKKDSALYLTGNLQLFSPAVYEPERPIYISLKRESMATEAKNKLDKIVDEIEVTSCPSQDCISLRFNLTEASSVEIEVFALNGKKVFEEHHGSLPSGEHRQHLSLNLLPGLYTFKVKHGSEAASTILVKE